ncbi:MAG: TRAM domain-containing protein, partial [Polyangiaceae bacterium]|nr:TRAM domain-containing protein [Polyangiaceae bacterium]
VDEQKEAHLSSLVGTEVEVLIEGRSKTGHWTGRSYRNEILHLQSDLPPEVKSEELAPGAFVQVRVVEAYRNSLSGKVERVVSEAPSVLRSSGQLPSGDASSKGIAVPPEASKPPAAGRRLPMMLD